MNSVLNVKALVRVFNHEKDLLHYCENQWFVCSSNLDSIPPGVLLAPAGPDPIPGGGAPQPPVRQLAGDLLAARLPVAQRRVTRAVEHVVAWTRHWSRVSCIMPSVT